jgi:hypothetical protein
MAGLVFDEQSLVDQSVYKYDQFLHSRINKYTGNGRIMVTYYNINDQNTTDSLGLNVHYQLLGVDSPLRYDKITKFPMLDLTPVKMEEKQASTSQARDLGTSGEVYIIPGTIMPKENDFFIINHLKMNHLFRVTQVGQDSFNTDGSYRVSYELFSTNPNDIEQLERQTVGEFVTDFRTIGGSDLTPVIGKEEYDHRSRLIKMVNDMTENYIARYYDHTHNCFILHLNGRSLFDYCGNYFMAKNSIMINDSKIGNIILKDNKLNDPRLDFFYEKSVYKWIERDAPLRYLDKFKFRIMKGYDYPDSSFAMYGDDIDVMLPVDPWCDSDSCMELFSDELVMILDEDIDCRTCKPADCKCCNKAKICPKHYKCQRYDYVSIIHDFIHGYLTSIDKLSLYTGDQLFDNYDNERVYLWSPIIIYIIKQILKIQ